MIAATKFQKATLKKFNQLVSKLQSAKGECTAAIADISDHYPSEDTGGSPV